MRCLIVGASSLANVIKPLLAAKMDVTIAGRHDCDIYLDLKEPIDSLDHDIIINTAAYFGDNELEAEEINVQSSLKLCQSAKQCKHFIFISSMSIHLDSSSPYFNIYAASKKRGEDLLKNYCHQYNIPLTIIRPSQIYGVSDDFKKHRPFIYTVAEQAKQGEDIYIFGSHDALRNYVHAEDVANIIDKIIDTGLVGEYDCCGLEDVSFTRVAQAANAAFGKNSGIFFQTEKANIPDNVFAIDTSLYESLNYHPSINIEMGLSKIAEQK